MGGLQSTIPTQEITFHPTSFCDKDGRVFWWQGNLYRGISKKYAPFCRKLFEDGSIQHLIEKKFLIETELSDLSLGGYSLVLKHRCIPFVSYAHEWCPEMLRDAAFFITDMMIELDHYGLTLVDVGTWDMLFDGTQPVFVDFCSIGDADFDGDRSWKTYREDFYSYFIEPLRLMTKGYGRLARWLMADYDHVAFEDFTSLIEAQRPALARENIYKNSRKLIRDSIPDSLFPAVRSGFRSIKSILKNLSQNNELYGIDLVQHLQQDLETIPLPSTWISQAKVHDLYLPLTPSDQWTQTHHCAYTVLSDLGPSTVLDMGCGFGWYSLLAASLGSKVVAVDVDDRKVAHCYRAAQHRNLPILPLVMDIRYPSPGHGICNQTIAPAIQRLPCDMVLALDLVHLLIFEQHLTFEQISETFKAFANKWLLVEFISREDQIVQPLWSEWHSWYTLDNFVAALQKNFSTVNSICSNPSTRILILCQR